MSRRRDKFEAECQAAKQKYLSSAVQAIVGRIQQKHICIVGQQMHFGRPVWLLSCIQVSQIIIPTNALLLEEDPIVWYGHSAKSATRGKLNSAPSGFMKCVTLHVWSLSVLQCDTIFQHNLGHDKAETWECKNSDAIPLNDE